MKQTCVLCIATCLLTQAFSARAVQGGAGHYTSGQYGDFVGMPGF